MQPQRRRRRENKQKETSERVADVLVDFFGIIAGLLKNVVKRDRDSNAFVATSISRKYQCRGSLLLGRKTEEIVSLYRAGSILCVV